MRELVSELNCLPTKEKHFKNSECFIKEESLKSRLLMEDESLPPYRKISMKPKIAT